MGKINLNEERRKQKHCSDVLNQLPDGAWDIHLGKEERRLRAKEARDSWSEGKRRRKWKVERLTKYLW